MDQCEDREEGVPPSKSTLCGEHESQTKAQRNPPEPPPSSVSLQSDASKDADFDFKVSAAERTNTFSERDTLETSSDTDSSRVSMCQAISSVSLTSNWSMDQPLVFAPHRTNTFSERDTLENFSDTDSGHVSMCQAISSLSLTSNWSMDQPLVFAPHRVEPAGVRWLRPGLRKYSCELTIDTNTVHRNLKLSDNNRKVTCVKEVQSYPDHPDRFHHWEQLLCRNGLTGFCYWEVEWRGEVYISVSYRRIRRKGSSNKCGFGCNNKSWSLYCCSDGPQSVWHNNRETSISSSSSSSSSSVSNRVAVYVDCPAGTLSFYRVSSDTLIHLHTFNTTFTETLYPGFTVGPASSVSLC